MKQQVKLELDHIIKTIDLLEKRTGERFPDSGLRTRCTELLAIARKSQRNISWISKPNIPLMIFAYLIIAIGLAAIVYSISVIHVEVEKGTLFEIVQTSEAMFNDIVLLGAAIFFLVTLEAKIKRRKVLKFLNELRVLCHVIDMHQLTKDPHKLDRQMEDTENSPKTVLTKYELQRYLDYCSEAFSLIGKVAAIYSQTFPDEVIVRSVNEIETLSSGLSNKVWQKLIILNEMILRDKK